MRELLSNFFPTGARFWKFPDVCPETVDQPDVGELTDLFLFAD